MALDFKNKQLMATIILLLPLIAFTQNTIYNEIYNLNTKLAPKKVSMDKSIISYGDNFIYFFGQHYSIDKNELVIKEFNTVSKSLSLLKINKTKENKGLFTENITSFNILKNKCVILTNENIYIFEKTNNSFIIKKIITNKYSFSCLYKINSSDLLLYVNYNFHPMDAQYKHAWGKLNLDGDSLYFVKKMGNDNARFSYFVNNWISTYNGLIAYANTTDYSIRLYNQKFELLDSIKSNFKSSNIPLLKYISNGDQYSADEMTQIRKADDTLLTRIQKIFLLDSTHLLVIIKLPKTRNMQFDIWVKKSDKWGISKSNTLPSYYETGKSYDLSNNNITGFFGNFDGLVYANNFEFYFCYFPFIENIISNSFDFEKDYNDKINKLTRENQIYYGIKKIKIICD